MGARGSRDLATAEAEDASRGGSFRVFTRPDSKSPYLCAAWAHTLEIFAKASRPPGYAPAALLSRCSPCDVVRTQKACFGELVGDATA